MLLIKVFSLLKHMNPDFFLAYGLSLVNFNSEAEETLLHLQKIKRTFPLLTEIIFSDRHPYTIMQIASRIGMYIPPKKRVGIFAYEFFIANVSYFEDVREQPDPSLYDIHQANDSLKFLMKFKDCQILKSGYKFSRNYNDRRSMLEKFINENILPYGKFKLVSHAQNVYDSKAQVITYTDHRKKQHFSVQDLLKRINQNNDCSESGEKHPPFSNLSLLHLRQQILEQIEQWHHRDGSGKNYVAPSLQNLLQYLETILQYEAKNEMSAYLGHPVFL
jgi:hypothetical protein